MATPPVNNHSDGEGVGSVCTDYEHVQLQLNNPEGGGGTSCVDLAVHRAVVRVEGEGGGGTSCVDPAVRRAVVRVRVEEALTALTRRYVELL